ncbi:MAG: hypothetical protein WAV90_00565 [Gordonia amarae]
MTENVGNGTAAESSNSSAGVVRQIVISSTVIWDEIVQMLSQRGICLSRMPQFGDGDGIENYCLAPADPAVLGPGAHVGIGTSNEQGPAR